MGLCRIFPPRWHFIFNVLIMSQMAISLPIAALLLYASATFQTPSLDFTYPISTFIQSKPYTSLSEFSEGDFLFDHAPYQFSLPLPSIENELAFIGFNQRPDCSLEESEVLIQSKSTNQSKLIKQHKPIFCSLDSQGKLSLSDRETPYVAEAKLTQDQNLELKFTANFTNSDGSLLHRDSTSYQLDHKVIEKRQPSQELDDLSEHLQKFSLYPPDQLLEIYGGRSFQHKKGCYRLSLKDADLQKLTFFSQDALLAFDGSSFSSSIEESKSKPLIRLTKTSHQIAHFAIWDPSGFTSQMISLPITLPPSLAEKANSLFSKIHKRTSQSVICKIGHQNLILRKGDWIVESKTSWRHLKNHEDINKFLSYGIKGKLFIFDGIDMQNDYYIFKGHLFDETRSTAYEFKTIIGKKSKRETKLQRKKDHIGQNAPLTLR